MSKQKHWSVDLAEQGFAPELEGKMGQESKIPTEEGWWWFLPAKGEPIIVTVYDIRDPNDRALHCVIPGQIGHCVVEYALKHGTWGPRCRLEDARANVPALVKEIDEWKAKFDESLFKIRDSTTDMWACAYADAVVKGQDDESATASAEQYWNTSEREPISSRAGTPLREIQVICSNCSGLGERPIRTFLGADRHSCGTCGSGSYILASNLYPPLVLPDHSVPAVVPGHGADAVTVALQTVSNAAVIIEYNPHLPGIELRHTDDECEEYDGRKLVPLSVAKAAVEQATSKEPPTLTVSLDDAALNTEEHYYENEGDANRNDHYWSLVDPELKFKGGKVVPLSAAADAVAYVRQDRRL